MASITTVIAVLFIAGTMIQKFALHQTIDPPPLEHGSVPVLDLPSYLWGYSEDLIEAPVEENIVVETIQPVIASFEYVSIQDPPPAEIEPTSEITASEDKMETDDHSLPPSDRQTITYKNLRAMLIRRKRTL